jgi:hypothetical protein
MTLHPISLKFPYTSGKFFYSFLSVCLRMLQGVVKNTVSLQKHRWQYCRDHTDAAAAPEPHWNQYQR